MLAIHFQLSGFRSYFPVSEPTIAEWDDDSITRIELTAEDPVCDPSSLGFADK